MVVTDAMAKKAAVSLVGAHPLTPGKFVVVVAGGEEEVNQAMIAGREVAAGALVDRLYLPKADPQLAAAMGGAVQVDTGAVRSLGIVETFSVAAAVLSADRAVKAAEVQILQLRLARGLGGKAFYVLTGELHQLEAGLEAGRSIIHDGMLLTSEVIPRPHADLVAAILAAPKVPPGY
jgi:microcompartment protein CcmL/EutN